MPSLGLSKNSFKIGQQHNFKVFGDALANCDVTGLTTQVANLVWSNVSTPGTGPNHVNVQATLGTRGTDRVTDTVGDLTVTVTDTVNGQTATQSYTVTYTT
jgi:hypothetical protein